MKVIELIGILSKMPPEANVLIRFDTEVIFSELTRGTETVIVDITPECIFKSSDEVILAADLGEKR